VAGAAAAGAGVGTLAVALAASSFVILPSFPVPFTEAASMPFSARILAAAGEGWPVAYELVAAAGAADLAGVAAGGAAGVEPPAGAATLVSIFATKAPISRSSSSAAT